MKKPMAPMNRKNHAAVSIAGICVTGTRASKQQRNSRKKAENQIQPPVEIFLLTRAGARTPQYGQRRTGAGGV